MLNIFNSADECPEFIPVNSLVNDKYELAVAKIQTGTVDAVIIDPPYTDGKTDALPNHKIQTKISISHIMQEVHRILKPEGFFVFFGQMPTVVEWLVEAQKVFKYREHITWCKRNITSPYLAIQRSKEDIFIYAKGKPPYYETQEKYEDLKVPGIHLGLYELTTYQQRIDNLQRRVKDNAYNMLYFQGINVDNSLVPMPTDAPNEEDFADEVMEDLDKLEKDLQALKITANNDIWRAKKLEKAVRDTSRDSKDLDKFDDLVKNQNENRPLSDRRNDALMQNAFQKTLENRAAAFEDLDKSQPKTYANNTKKNDIQTGKMYGMQNAENFEDLEKDQKLQIGRGDHNDKTLRYTSKERPKHEFEDLERGQKLEVAHGKANDKWLENKLPNAARERAEFEENREKGKQVGYQDPASNDKTWNKGRTVKSAHRYESKHWCNITNTWYFLPEPEDRAVAEICTVWSYLGQNQTTFGDKGENWKHPTVKPVKLLKRLIKLLTPEPEKAGYTPVIVDFFNGSGTTTKAAAELGRAFIGVELQPDYFAMTVARTDAAIKGEQILSKDVAIASTQPVMPQQQKLF